MPFKSAEHARDYYFRLGTRAYLNGNVARLGARLGARTGVYTGCHQAYAQGYVRAQGYARLLASLSRICLTGKLRPRLSYGCR